MEVSDTRIGPDSSPFFIAEAGVNHNGELKKAKELIDVAAEAGADAVKFQTFSADRLVAKDTSTTEYQQESTDNQDQYEMLKKYELSRDNHIELIEYSNSQEITFLSSPFDFKSVDLLIELGVDALKIGSGELTNHPLLKYVSGREVPLIVSTGMGTMDEVQEAYDVIQSTDPETDVVFLHCTSDYPCSLDDVNLQAMRTMMSKLDIPIGYSDHTLITETPGLAVAAGACVVEKHFTLDRELRGPDHSMSLEPEGLRQAVEFADVANRIRGDSKKQPTAEEMESRPVTRKSLHAARDIKAGSTIARSDVKIVRPTSGLPPKKYESVLGQTASHDIATDEPIRSDAIQKGK